LEKKPKKKRKTDLGFWKKSETKIGRKRKESERKWNGSFRKNRTEGRKRDAERGNLGEGSGERRRKAAAAA